MNDLLIKGIQQKKNAGVLFVGGAFVAALSALGYQIASNDEEKNKAALGVVLGTAGILASAPEFISGVHKIHKAKVALSVRKNRYLPERSRNQLVASIKIPL